MKIRIQTAYNRQKIRANQNRGKKEYYVYMGVVLALFLSNAPYPRSPSNLVKSFPELPFTPSHVLLLAPSFNSLILADQSGRGAAG
jgi:hypothetical protein